MDGEKSINNLTIEQGRIVYYGHTVNPTSASLKKKKILLTLVSENDEELLRRQGLAALRQARILRICQQAHEQGALLAYEDLTSLLSTSLSTIKRDLRVFKKEGLPIAIYRKKQRPVRKG